MVNGDFWTIQRDAKFSSLVGCENTYSSFKSAILLCPMWWQPAKGGRDKRSEVILSNKQWRRVPEESYTYYYICTCYDMRYLCYITKCKFTSKSACFKTSSALILFRINSASFATRTMWSRIAWESSRPSFISSMKASPACFCKEFCHSWEHNNITSSTTDVLVLNVWRPAK